MAFAAVLFDLDGTLIDSLPLFRVSIDEALRQQGRVLDASYFPDWHARRLPWSDLLARHDLDVSLEVEVRAFSAARFGALLRSDVRWLDGAEELLRDLIEKGVPTGIVTTASREAVDAVSQRLLLTHLVPTIVTGDDVGGKTKPDPHGLLLAAGRLAVQPDRCLYVGDQPFDVAAANAAGMASCLVAGPESLAASEARFVVHRLGELGPLISLGP